jgi:type II secretory pathway pseudopilin PulG
MEQEQIVLLDKILKSPLPPFTKGGLGGITGLTLIEVLIALVVFLLISIALMQTALVVIDSNMINVLRDEAVNIAEMRMNDARNLGFTETVNNLDDDGVDASLTAAVCPAEFVADFGTTGLLVTRNFRNITGFSFCTNRTVTELGGDGSLATNDAENRQVTITVGWIWKGQDYTHTISTIVRRQ